MRKGASRADAPFFFAPTNRHDGFVMDLFLTAAGGFLVAVIWMDLMFDVLALRGRGSTMSEADLEIVASYYRRVTTTASPMNYLISAVMTGMIVVLVVQLARGDGARAVAASSLGLCAVPITLALVRVFPDAMRLGTRRDSLPEQSRLARSICLAHIGCIAAMLAFLLLRLVSAR
jgi:hypothetical protein